MLTGGFRTLKGATAALDENALDVVGFARPFALVPELGLALLAGKEPVIPLYPKMRSQRFNSPAEFAWYSRQLVRLSRGDEPDLQMSPGWALVKQLFGDVIQALKRNARAYRMTSSRTLAATVGLPSGSAAPK